MAHGQPRLGRVRRGSVGVCVWVMVGVDRCARMELCWAGREWVGLGDDRADLQAPSAEARGHSRSQLARATDLALTLGSRPLVEYASRKIQNILRVLMLLRRNIRTLAHNKTLKNAFARIGVEPQKPTAYEQEEMYVYVYIYIYTFIYLIDISYISRLR